MSSRARDGSSGAARAIGCTLVAAFALAAGPGAEARCHPSFAKRCLPPGSLDPTFGAQQYAVFYDLGNGLSRGAMDMAVLPDGRIVLGGSSTTNGGTDHDPTLARFTAEGKIDTTFGTGGVVRTVLGPGNAIIQSIAVQPDGKILAAGGYDDDPLRIPGYTTGYSPQTSFLARFEPDGALDASFGTGGMVVVSTPGNTRGYDRVLLPGDGSILTVGFRSGAPGTAGVFVERRGASGALDATFGTGGVALSPGASFTWTPYYRTGAGLQADGKIVVGGAAFAVGPYINCALARFNPDGTLDSSFGGGQVALAEQPNEVCNVQSIVPLADGKILAAGAFYDDPEKMKFTLMRLDADGSFDTSFKGKGRVFTRVTNQSVTVTTHAVAVQPDGRIVEAGSAGGGEFDAARHLENGGHDSRFGGRNGRPPSVVRTQRPGPTWTAVFDGAQAVSILPDGKILVGGNPGHTSTFALARYLGSTCLYDNVAQTLACE